MFVVVSNEDVYIGFTTREEAVEWASKHVYSADMFVTEAKRVAYVKPAKKEPVFKAAGSLGEMFSI